MPSGDNERNESKNSDSDSSSKSTSPPKETTVQAECSPPDTEGESDATLGHATAMGLPDLRPRRMRISIYGSSRSAPPQYSYDDPEFKKWYMNKLDQLLMPPPRSNLRLADQMKLEREKRMAKSLSPKKKKRKRELFDASELTAACKLPRFFKDDDDSDDDSDDDDNGGGGNGQRNTLESNNQNEIVFQPL